MKNNWKIISNWQTEYLIKFKGYPDSENLWQTVESLDCDQKIRDYEGKNRSGRTRRSRSRRNDMGEFFEYDDIVDKRIVDDKVWYCNVLRNIYSKNVLKMWNDLVS